MLFPETILHFSNAFKISLKNFENCHVYYVLETEFELWIQIAKNDTKTINDETCIITGAKIADAAMGNDQTAQSFSQNINHNQ